MNTAFVNLSIYCPNCCQPGYVLGNVLERSQDLKTLTCRQCKGKWYSPTVELENWSESGIRIGDSVGRGPCCN